MSLSKSAGGCFICKSAEDDELLYGKMVGKWKIRVHYYCLLLTSNLVQNGESDEEGIFGFLQEDIRAEVTRIRSQKCYVCKAPYANISCCAKKCFRTFHTVCGRRGGCLSYFEGTYQSWCDRHVELNEKVRHEPSDACGICYEELGEWDKLESIRAPCCQNGWFHRRCVAQFAQTAGYFFKCPLCNNKDFAKAIKRRGVYVPEKDAAWELEPNAFGEQLERPSECDAEVCLCRYGRDYDTLNGKWDLRLCETCGSTCRHDLCMEVPTKNYVCNFCRPIVGDEPPAAVLALAEESRRAEAARRRASISSEASSGTSSSSSIGRNRNRRTQRLRSLSSSSRCSSSTTASDIVVHKKAKKRPITSSDSDSGCELETLIRKLPLRQEAREKLLTGRIVIRLEKLSAQQIQDLTKPPHQNPPPATSSQSSSDAPFDFNYRARMTKLQRRKSVADMHLFRDVLRSDTDTLATSTDDNQQQQQPVAKTPSRKGSGAFAKQFKLKLGGGAKTMSAARRRKRIVSSSESDPEAGQVPAAKKSCPSTAPAVSKSKSRISLFPPTVNDAENTCPNSPRKLTSVDVPAESELLSPPPPPESSSAAGSTAKKCQTTLNSFFKKSPEEDRTGSSGSGSGSGGGAIHSSSAGDGKSAKKKHSAGSARKKLVELDRSQRNLLDFFNRC